MVESIIMKNDEDERIMTDPPTTVDGDMSMKTATTSVVPSSSPTPSSIMKVESEDGDEEKKKETSTEMKEQDINEKEDEHEDKKNDDDDDNDIDDDGKTKQEKEQEEKEKAEAEKKRIEELKKKYADWPLRNVKEPHDNDVMYGRGGGTNHHPGNKRYRTMVEDRKLEYVNSKRLDKPLVALEIIRLWRAQLPPGRFLKLDEKTGLWNDVGDKKAREKTSQALREKAPLIRKQQEEEENGEDDNSQEDEGKTTRFAEGTKGDASSSKVKKAVLARDHSLGREYLEKGEAVSLEGFSWQDPFKGGKRDTSIGATNSATSNVPITRATVPTYVPAGRNSSSGSLGMAPPYHQTSIGGPPPPPPDYYGRVASGDQRREFSNSSLGSWGAPYPYPPPPPPAVPGMHQRSGSWTHSMPPPSPHHGSHHQRSGSWGGGREHSLSFNPLIGASISRPADRGAFSSGYWGEHVPPTARGVIPPPPPPPGAYGALPYTMSGGSAGPPPGPYRQSPSPSNSNTPSPPYNVDMSIARSWSGGEIQRNWSGEYSQPPEMGPPQYDGHPRPVTGADSSPQRAMPSYGYGGGYIPRPTMVKRDTSNQNETYETKPSIKKAALNRDQSATSNRLKQEYMPDYYNRQFDTEKEMQTLQETTEQIRLSPGPAPRPKPQALGQEGRVTTIDAITMDLMAKPSSLLEGNRVSTIDALDLDFDGSDPALRDDFDNTGQRGSSLPRPSALGANNRLTTQEFLEIVTAPIATVDNKGDDDDDDDDPLPLVQERQISDGWVAQN